MIDHHSGLKLSACFNSGVFYVTFWLDTSASSAQASKVTKKVKKIRYCAHAYPPARIFQLARVPSHQLLFLVKK
jgi:hypothetical protein